MPDNPFSNPAFTAMGGQMVQMWQSALESWWSSLLDDSGRLGELARKLGEAGHPGGASNAGAEDLGRVLDALELMEKRIQGLEDRLRDQSESLAAVVEYLEKLSGGEGERGSDEGGA